MEPGDTVKVRGYRGIAFVFCGHPRVNHADDDCMDCDCRDEDRAVVVMVGDDRRETVDLDDLTPLDRSEFCGDCGQIGCGHNTEG